jgi:hypothetical protein
MPNQPCAICAAAEGIHSTAVGLVCQECHATFFPKVGAATGSATTTAAPSPGLQKHINAHIDMLKTALHEGDSWTARRAIHFLQDNAPEVVADLLAKGRQAVAQAIAEHEPDEPDEPAEAISLLGGR